MDKMDKRRRCAGFCLLSGGSGLGPRWPNKTRPTGLAADSAQTKPALGSAMRNRQTASAQSP